jgi:hypothetical protein
MSQLGQERRIGAVRNISALSPRADVGADIVEPPNRFAAQSGHVARSPGAQTTGGRRLRGRVEPQAARDACRCSDFDSWSEGVPQGLRARRL